ncbi:acyltransferase [Dyadobacter sp. 32]|uniref:acyltransferase n=1 Tax=Dyadobacter sp. 32 TaxID=538966 RepID=UPI0039C6D54B
MKFPKLKLLGKINLHGLPNFQIYGTTTFGSEITLTSSSYINPAGLTKPCGIYVKENANLSIGKGSGLSGVTIVSWNKITIGENCGIGANVSIWDTDFHGIYFENRTVKDKIKTAPIHIGNDVWIGANCMILKGVTIGDRSVIGAGSLVNKNIPPDEVWGGNPAKFIRRISI